MIDNMPTNNLKNEKLKNDIKEQLPEKNAKLAIDVLSMIESAGGDPDFEEVRKMAIRDFGSIEDE